MHKMFVYIIVFYRIFKIISFIPNKAKYQINFLSYALVKSLISTIAFLQNILESFIKNFNHDFLYCIFQFFFQSNSQKYLHQSITNYLNFDFMNG